MEPFTIAMIAVSAMQAGQSMMSANQQAKALKDQAAYRAMVLASNRKLANFQATEAIDTGERDVGKIRTYRDKVIGAQKVSLAAQGLDITSGSALAVQQETNYFAERDIQTTRNNAWKEAWGFKLKAEQMGMEGQLADMSTDNQVKSTYLTGGLNALSYGIQGMRDFKKG